MKNLLITFALAFSLQAVGQYNGRGVDINNNAPQYFGSQSKDDLLKEARLHLFKGANNEVAAWSFLAASAAAYFVVYNTGSKVGYGPSLALSFCALSFKIGSIHNYKKGTKILLELE